MTLTKKSLFIQDKKKSPKTSSLTLSLRENNDPGKE
jgi:hypothetical protein